MKSGLQRIVLAAILVGAASLAGLWPFTAVDAAKVVPVETLAVAREAAGYCLYAGDGLTGRGATLDEALENLEQTAPGTVFFGTVQRVILPAESLDLAHDLLLGGQFRPSVWVYGSAVPKEAEAEVLEAHESRSRDGATLGRVAAAQLGGPAISVAKVAAVEGSWQLVDD